MRTLNYKRKSRRRFFLLMWSRTPLISSEFRGGGLKPPNPPPQYATERIWLSLKQDGQCTYNVTLRWVRTTIVAVEKHQVLNIINACLYSCFSYLECKLHLFCTKLYCHMWPVWLYHIFTLLHKGHNFQTTFFEHRICVLIFSATFSETFLILKRIEEDIIMHVYRSSCKVPIILIMFWQNWNFCGRFSKVLKYYILWKSVQREQSCYMRTGGQTWRS